MFFFSLALIWLLNFYKLHKLFQFFNCLHPQKGTRFILNYHGVSFLFKKLDLVIAFALGQKKMSQRNKMNCIILVSTYLYKQVTVCVESLTFKTLLELGQCSALQLSDPFLGQTKYLAYILQCFFLAIFNTKSQPDYALFFRA